jgi:outer membrane protein OmpA-like peptidoglycan-associated protein
MTGAQGSTGNTGKVGSQGVAGTQGTQGRTGSQGLTGSQGMTGSQGVTGSQGRTGQAGMAESQPVPGGPWVSLRQIRFDYDKASIPSSEMGKIADIASYMSDNPGVRLGIDGTTDLHRGTNKYNVELSQQREANVRDALIRAGVSADRMETGGFAAEQAKCTDRTEKCSVRDGKVEVLASS